VFAVGVELRPLVVVTPLVPPVRVIPGVELGAPDDPYEVASEESPVESTEVDPYTVEPVPVAVAPA
jgi:hypothetical protein